MSQRLHYKTCIIFGGTGFIGCHFALELLAQGVCDVVYLADVKDLDRDEWPGVFDDYIAQGKIVFVSCDVRNKISAAAFPPAVDLICNFAAVHKQPGHQPFEYFETNLKGAENVCAFAEEVSCKIIVFTSSIATYGNVAPEKNEQSLTAPSSPYGISKLVAEKIHLGWQQKDGSRQLLVVRPGVIFGHAEKGNVTRMVRALLGRYFFYTGNKQLAKAGGYVKDLCSSLLWMLSYQQEHKRTFLLYNFTLDPAPTLERYTEAILKAAGLDRRVLSIPFWLLLVLSYGVSAFGWIKPFSGINPTRVRKLLDANKIVPTQLHDSGYKYRFSLEDAMKDWRREWPQDWQ